MALQLEAIQLLGRHHHRNSGMLTSPGLSNGDEPSDPPPGSIGQPTSGSGRNITFDRKLYNPRAALAPIFNMVVSWTPASSINVTEARLYNLKSLSSSGFGDQPNKLLGFGSVNPNPAGTQPAVSTTLTGKSSGFLFIF